VRVSPAQVLAKVIVQLFSIDWMASTYPPHVKIHAGYTYVFQRVPEPITILEPNVTLIFPDSYRSSSCKIYSHPVDFDGLRHFLDASSKLAPIKAGLTVPLRPLSTSNFLCQKPYGFILDVDCGI